jgi:hypothetical protein
MNFVPSGQGRFQQTILRLARPLRCLIFRGLRCRAPPYGLCEISRSKYHRNDLTAASARGGRDFA